MHEHEKWFVKNWRGDTDALARSLGISRQLAALLVGRAICTPDTARKFLFPDIGKMHNALLMKDMDTALDILIRAAAAKKKVLVIGDYDVDGIMGVLILCAVLCMSFRDVSHYIPHRVDDGYGINERIVERAYCDGIGLIVTCDNGISAFGAVRLAKSMGIDVIITDHHEPQTESEDTIRESPYVPEADAVIDPKRRDCKYPFKSLCGAAVTFKFAMAYAERACIAIPERMRDELFGFMTIATICDIVELVDENRAIAYHGLRLLNGHYMNAGLAGLVVACGLSDKPLNSHNIGHIIGPCINAAGRLDSAELSYRLFIENDPKKIADISASLTELNRTRQNITQDAVREAVRIINSTEDESGSLTKSITDRTVSSVSTVSSISSVIVLYMPDTHESVAGIVAGKIKDRFARPVIILTDSASGLAKGSGRSVDGFDLFTAILKTRDLLVKYGGHPMAVGITIEKDNIDSFRDALNKKNVMDRDLLIPKERIDLCINASDISMSLINDIARLEPFGRGNDKPLFAIKGLTIEQVSLLGVKRNVVRMKLRHQDGHPLDAVYFGDTDVLIRTLGLVADSDGTISDSRGTSGFSEFPKIDILFHPEINNYNGYSRIQLIIRSARISAI